MADYGKGKYQRGAYISKDLFESKAYRSLTKAQMRLYQRFLMKREFARVGGKPGKRKKDYVQTNVGKIAFPYREAERIEGVNLSTFGRAIRKYVEVGLLDITHAGAAYEGDCHLYGISERWIDYGTDKFKEVLFPKDFRLRGWSLHHQRNKLNQRPKLIRRKRVS